MQSSSTARPAGLPRGASRALVAALTSVALLGFAANSLLCRLALRDGAIDAASFTAVRIACGAAMLVLLHRLRGGRAVAGDWRSALALFVYAATFSLAYVSIPAGAGALLLFGSVQATMIARGLVLGENPHWYEWCGLLLACSGIVVLLAPGLSAPPLGGGLAMMAAGIAWGVYSLRGRRNRDAIAATAGNFLRALPLSLLLVFAARLGGGEHPTLLGQRLTATGLAEAALSGALASGLGYAVWYTVLPSLTAMRAAVVQLAVPILVAAAGVALLGEHAGLRLVACAALTLGGVALATGHPLYLAWRHKH